MSGEPAAGVRGPLVVAWLFGLAVGLLASLAVVVALGLLFAPGIVDDLRVVMAARLSSAPITAPAPPATAPTPRPVPRMPAPRYVPGDSTRSAPDAYAAMMHASQRGDAATVAKYLLRSELARRQPVEEALRELMPPVPIEALDLVRWKAIGDRAVLLFKAQAPRVLDAKRKQAPIQVVVRMAREDGYWKMFRQTWLINAALGQQESEALAWAAAGAR